LDGVSEEKGLPERWSTEENVTWKVALPSRSGATPIVWGETIFLNVAEGDDLQLWALDRGAGTVKGKKKLGGGNYKINKQNMSSPSPVTDGKAVFVMTGTGIFKAFVVGGRELVAGGRLAPRPSTPSRPLGPQRRVAVDKHGGPPSTPG